MVLVDSSVWIEALRSQGDVGVKHALEALLDADEALWCGPVKLEVLGGARPDMRRRLAFFFDAVPYRDPGSDSWPRAVRLSWGLRDAGLTIPWNDILIAALAMQWGCPVFALDRHFRQIAEIAPLDLYEPRRGGGVAP
jgi:predicted nucleic acid-binding protein